MYETAYGKMRYSDFFYGESIKTACSDCGTTFDIIAIKLQPTR